MKRRGRVPDYSPEGFRASGWSKETARAKAVTLKNAQQERQAVKLPLLEEAGQRVEG
jgi:hypothetical protein